MISKTIEKNKMKIDPLISVIVPVYMVECYLERCINSIVNQSYRNLEIILVNDGSTDGCALICDEWQSKDSRIIVIHKKNGGLSSARNAGIDVSRGEYITFIDSDDWVSDDYVECLYGLLIRNNADLSMGQLKKTNDENLLFRCKQWKEQVISGRQFLFKVLKVKTQENVQYACGKLFKNFKYSSIRFPEGLIDEDVPTTFKYATKCQYVAMSTKVIYAYFENENSISRKKFNKKRFDLIKVWEIIVDFAKKNCDDEIIKYAEANYYRANFGILCNMCTENWNPVDMKYILKKEKIILRIVKEHRNQLLSFPMPITRKVFVIGFSLCYPLSKRILKMTGVRA